MRAGQLHQLVTFQEKVTTLNDYNEPTDSWQDFTTCNASVIPLTAREFFNSAQVQYDVTHKVTCRYEPDITAAMRILYGSRVLYIVSVVNVDEADAMLELLCKETP